STLPQTDYKFAKKHKSVKPSPRTYQFDGGVDESTLFLVNGNGHNNIVTVSRLTPDQTVEPVSDEQWQKIIDIIVLAPQFIELAKEMNLALSDIINAADNKQPYNAKELEDNFMPYCGKMHELLKELGEERK
ncbi:TPA: hypothetical protein HA278_04325, partial [Candidatus Woesearchaeota archaeon]|nr:hypothetical protein [Candidatus Woesearchaeota archaeon]